MYVDTEVRSDAEALLAGENRILEMLARAEPLDTVLEQVCRLLEETSPGSLASICLVDAQRNPLLKDNQILIHRAPR